MNATRKSAASIEAQLVLENLKEAVAQALEKKRRLGQYAVIWKDGKPILTGDDAPKSAEPRK
ncbi:hypothetical protein M1B72_17785 [Geomonas paludis]|uniref:Uncharacterized protein n=1 Tax=Geomonas paludis TaxID=2740185 RepID=A0ABY4LEJ2_9BACT|nr:hypothetical protein [Geomonas paludis]UPU35275.1 hypothetical protein M1B72_17785 [Geomonas paludis]